ncbi:electron transfer flavoprotein subunit alpha/FixB family protein [Chloroflexota bacterium]
MKKEIWVVADHDGGDLNEVTYEILGEAHDLAKSLDSKVCVILIGHQVQRIIDVVAGFGADTVYLVQHELLVDYVTDIYTSVMVNLVQQRQPAIIIFGDTSQSHDLAAGLAAQIKAPIATDCVKLELNEDSTIMATRPSYGDQVYVKLAFSGEKPYLVTMRPGVIGIESQNRSRGAEVIRVDPAIEVSIARTKLKRKFKLDPATIPLSEAEVIVAGGAGASTKEDWYLIKELAELIEASVGGSRVAADRGFISTERVIGLSGTYITPKLYIAIGISGASHHTQGIKEAKSIVTINIDRAAPIFNMADLKVIADLHLLLPEINNEIRRTKAVC